MPPKPPPTTPFLGRLYNKLAAATSFLTETKTQCVCICIALIFLLASLEDPDFPPSLPELFVGVVTFVCAGTLIYTCIVIIDFLETCKWAWEIKGWVWPWERWLWASTVYAHDEGETVLDDDNDGGVDTCPADQMPVNDSMVRRTRFVPHSMQEDTDAALRRKRRLQDELLAPVPSFKHFSGSGFAKRERMRKAVTEWATAGTSEERKKEALGVLMEEDSEQDVLILSDGE